MLTLEDLKNDLGNVKLFDLDGYEEIRQIGYGGFGQTILAQKNSNNIIIKQFFHPKEPKVIEFIKREIINQSECHKKNLIVPFLGISFTNFKKEPLEIPWLIMEYEEGGSLAKLNKSKIDDIQKMIIIYGIAKGIQFLHHIPISHRDLNPNNIVFNSQKYPLICDFGASRQISMVHVDDGTFVGTLRYLSPEMLQEDIKTDIFLPTDIFSFGTIIYNLLTDEIPYKKEIKNIGLFTLKNFLESGKRIELPDTIPSWFRYLIELCWKQNPEERPTIDDIVNLFDSGITLPKIYDDAEGSKIYYSYQNDFLHLDNKKINTLSLIEWRDRLLKDSRTKKIALTIDFMLSDYFDNPDYFNHTDYMDNSDSQTKLGFCYFNGYLVEQNFQKSVEYFLKAAQQENPKSLFYLSEIYRFGLVENDINIDISKSNSNLEQSAELEYKPAIDYLSKVRECSSLSKENCQAIVIAGDESVGKTSFINHVLRGISEPLLMPTTTTAIRNYYLPMELKNQQKIMIQIQDTGGYSKLESHFDEISRNTQMIILVFDKTNDQSFNNLDRYYNLFKSNLNFKGKFLLLGTKIDLNDRTVSRSDAKRKAEEWMANYFEISALRSINSEDVLDFIQSHLSKLNSGTVEEEIHIKRIRPSLNQNECDSREPFNAVILGDSCVGKTCFLDFLSGDAFKDTSPTLGAHDMPINLDFLLIRLWDTPGQTSIRPTISLHVRSRQLFFIMFDLTSRESFNDVNVLFDFINDNVHRENFKIILIGNKKDRESDRAVSYEEGKNKAISINASYAEISCLNKEGFDEVISLIRDAYQEIMAKESDDDQGNVQLVEDNSGGKNKCKC